MTSEIIQLEPDKDRYPLRSDYPIERVFMRLGEIDYAIILISPAQMASARESTPEERRPRGYPAFASIMLPQQIDIYPAPSTDTPKLYVIYDDQAVWEREQERHRWIWQTEYRRTHF